MGLCKCPKRKVTNQFCFEHRVNVCEHCMVTNHPKCVIQSYLQWLQDSDCNPICTLCSENLSNGECIRLTCYHVYHWACLDNYGRNLPKSTTPEGYICPTCNDCIFPQLNLVSPVADVLREKLAGVNWARAGLGLPLLSEDEEQRPERKSLATNSLSHYENHAPTQSRSSSTTSRTSGSLNSSNLMGNNVHSNQSLEPPYSVINIESTLPSLSQMQKKVFEAYDDPKNFSFDHDENKYKRKSAIDLFLRWWRLIIRPQARRRNSPGSVYKRYATLAIVGIILFILMIMMFSWLGKMATDGDPSYSPLNNPMIKVKHDNEVPVN